MYIGKTAEEWGELGVPPQHAIDASNALAWERLGGGMRNGLAKRTANTDILQDLNWEKFPGHDPDSKAFNYAYMRKIMEETRVDANTAEKAMREIGDKSGDAAGGVRGKGKGKGKESKIPYTRQEVYKLAAMGVLRETLTFTREENKWVDDDHGKQSKVRPIEGMKDFRKIPLSDLARPDFGERFARRQILIEQKRKKVGVEKTFFVLVDDSGSMANDRKIAYVDALLTLLHKNKNEVYYGKFETDIHEKGKVRTVEEFMENYSPCHGDTNVYQCINEAKEMIVNLKWGEDELTLDAKKVSIVIINDGQDEIGNKIPTIVTHAVSIGTHNTDLQRLCQGTSGTYMLV